MNAMGTKYPKLYRIYRSQIFTVYTISLKGLIRRINKSNPIGDKVHILKKEQFLSVHSQRAEFNTVANIENYPAWSSVNQSIQEHGVYSRETVWSTVTRSIFSGTVWSTGTPSIFKGTCLVQSNSEYIRWNRVVHRNTEYIQGNQCGIQEPGVYPRKPVGSTVTRSKFRGT